MNNSDQRLHGSCKDAGSQRWCADCQMWVGLIEWKDHRDHGDFRISTDGGRDQSVDEIGHVQDLERGELLEFEASGTSGIPSAVVTCLLFDPVFPPDEDPDDQISGSVTATLKNLETATVWNFREEIDPDDGLTGEIEVSVKACIDIRHPPRYRCQDRGTLVSCEIIGGGVDAE